MTERQQQDARLQELQAELVHISRLTALGEMASALAHELNQPLGLVRAVSYQVVEHVRAGRLQVVLQSFEQAPRPVHLVYDSRNRLPLKLRAFVDFVVPRLRERLTEAMF